MNAGDQKDQRRKKRFAGSGIHFSSSSVYSVKSRTNSMKKCFNEIQFTRNEASEKKAPTSLGLVIYSDH